ncbi:MAG: hypothetical protein HC902_08930 [Calothrix sp. SM1_5_4]|nr:hypothetical protein [Calothrix sp. SM1_5_4]
MSKAPVILIGVTSTQRVLLQHLRSSGELIADLPPDELAALFIEATFAAGLIEPLADQQRTDPAGFTDFLAKTLSAELARAPYLFVLGEEACARKGCGGCGRPYFACGIPSVRSCSSGPTISIAGSRRGRCTSCLNWSAGNLITSGLFSITVFIGPLTGWTRFWGWIIPGI